LHPISKKLTNIAEAICVYDALLNLTIFIVIAGIPSPRSTLMSASTVGLPIAYAVVGWLGKLSVKRKRSGHVMAYTIILCARILMDIGATIYYEVANNISVYSMNPLTFIFSLLSIGLRPFFKWIFPCSDPMFLEINGFCKDAIGVNGITESFNPHIIYGATLIYEMALGIYIVFYYRKITRKEIMNESIPIPNFIPQFALHSSLNPPMVSHMQRALLPYSLQDGNPSSNFTNSNSSLETTTTTETQDNQILSRNLTIPEE
jgi:hypothetical protein